MFQNGATSDDFNPANLARGLLKEDTGTGLSRDRQQVATLRVFTGPDDAEWLLYGGVQGGAQGKGWIEVYYRGILRSEGVRTFGDWVLRIEGSELEPLAHQLGKQVRNLLRVGKEETYEVKRVTIEPLKIEDQEEE